MIFTPSLAKISSNARVNLASRSRMKKRTRSRAGQAAPALQHRPAARLHEAWGTSRPTTSTTAAARRSAPPAAQASTQPAPPGLRPAARYERITREPPPVAGFHPRTGAFSQTHLGHGARWREACRAPVLTARCTPSARPASCRRDGQDVSDSSPAELNGHHGARPQDYDRTWRTRKGSKVQEDLPEQPQPITSHISQLGA